MIGAGFIAQVAHLPALVQAASCRVVALADDRPELLTGVADRFAIPGRYSHPAALLADPAVQAVVVSMPRRCQSALVRQALLSGRPVLSEKPLAYTAAVARELAATAAARGVPLGAIYQRRYDAGVRLFARRLAAVRADGSLGELLHVRASNFCARYAVAPPDHLRAVGPRPHRYPEDPVVPDGVPADLTSDYDYSVNVAIHDVNLLRLLFGEDIHPHACAIRRGGAQSLSLALPGADVALSVGPADLGTWEQRLDVYFQKGCLSLVQDSTLALQPDTLVIERSPRGEVVSRPPVEERVPPFRGQMAAFIREARGKGGMDAPGSEIDLTTAQDAVRDLELIEALWRIARVR